MVEEKIINVCHGSYIFVCKDRKQGKAVVSQLVKMQKIEKDNLFCIGGDGENIKISQIREIKNKIILKPNNGYLLVVIENANLLTTESGNALLKILEEPPVFCIIVLITNNVYTLLPTIISRCKKIYFNDESEREDFKYLNLFNQLQSARYNYQKIKLVDEIVKKEIDIKEMLHDWIKYLEKDINKNNINTIKKIYRFDNIYNVGLNQKLFLENLFLKMNL